MTGDLRIGTSGWHYPTGAGTWNGVFYPKPRPKGFDELAFYAEHFNTVEVNTTFYGPPKAAVAAEWARRTPPGFDFAVKLYQQFTHPRLFRARVQHTLATALDTTEIPDSAITALVTANQADLDAFKRGLDPLAKAHKLGPLLAQFPASFRDTPDNRAHLASLMRAFPGYPLAVELRHRSWSDGAMETRGLLEAFGAAWVWIDEPKFGDSIQQPDISPTPFVYMRLHGRNAKAWWQTQDRDARYAYDYSASELQAISRRLRSTSGAAQGRVYFNNHPNARAVANATVLMQLLEEPHALQVGSPIARPRP